MLDRFDEDLVDAKRNRFDHLLSGKNEDQLSLPSDVLIYRDDGMLVCPTLGSFLPRWYLMLPSEAHLNFRDWADQTAARCVSTEINRIVREVVGNDRDFIWFEHGPSEIGSITGCGTDYAHIHLLFETSFTVEDLRDAAEALGVSGWKRSSFDEAYEGISKSSEYLAFGDSVVGFTKDLLAPVGSQFFRRAIAYLSGGREDWDYRLHPHNELAQLSVDWLRHGRTSGLSES